MKGSNLNSLQINITTAAHIVLLITLVIMETVAANAIEEKLQHKSLISKSERFHVRTKRNSIRNAYLNEYYANYYNGYYSNYYNRGSNVYNSAASTRKSTIGFVGNFNNHNVNVVSAYDTKYTYTPIFKYRSTQQRKRHKLFVPV